MERSTTPPSWAAAAAFSGSSRSYGYGGGTKPPGAPPPTTGSGLADRELGQTSGGGRLEARPDVHAALAGLLLEHVALPVGGGQHVAPAERDQQVDHRGQGVQ